jgi:renalase
MEPRQHPPQNAQAGRRRKVAVVGAGLAGVTCASLLAGAGCEVQVFDKSRGPGGRMATRRATWADAQGVAHEAQFDHGTPAFTAHTQEFLQFVEQARRDGLLARWQPVLAPASYEPLGDTALWLPKPDMPALCRALLGSLPVHTGCAVDGLQRHSGVWSVHSAGQTVGSGYTDVVVAVPPEQAAPLLQVHQPDWAQRARSFGMVPCWTLMAVTDELPAATPTGHSQPCAVAWDLAWPVKGTLAWVLRNDRKPGRTAAPGQAHWVVHATANWSQTHLESEAAQVQPQMQQALEQWLGQPLAWHYAVVHRWRYASVSRSAAAPERCWWNPALGLGACGDALGGAGVEGAWQSGRTLAASVLQPHGANPNPSTFPTS